jgi:putative membrane protein
MLRPSRRVAATLAALAALAIPAALSAQSLTDANIVAIFDQANTADIETGDLGVKAGHDQRVRDLAQSFVAAHRAVRQQGRDLARKLGVTPALPAGDQGAAQLAAAMKQLRSKKGAEFDLAYLDHEIAFHQAVIDAVKQTLLPAIQNSELKAFVEKVAPAFQGHLDQAKTLRQQLGAMSSKR